MEHGKFYRFTELYEMTYGRELYTDFQWSDDNETLWLFVAKVLNLQTYLEVLVVLGKLGTGRKKRRSTSRATRRSAARWCTTLGSKTRQFLRRRSS